MSTKVKTAPVRLNESTLETNIVSEIASLFKYPGGGSIYSSRLRWFFGIPIAASSQNAKRVKIYRLTPQEEYHGGGWDSKIIIPEGTNGSRAVFIQFKSGRHSNGNKIPGSIFNLDIKSPNKHAEFTFNDNRNNNQHQTLKNLHEEIKLKGLPPKSVMYGFPRITDLETFDNLDEDLLLHTTFLSISEMDAKAKANGVNLYDSNIHHFRTCYFDDSKREIASDPFSIDGSEESSGLLYEILLVRLTHWRNQFFKDIPISVINEDLYFMLADFLRINPFESFDLSLSSVPPTFQPTLKQFYTTLENNSLSTFQGIFGPSGQRPIEWRKNLFKRAIAFFVERSRESIIDDIPTNHSFVLSDNFRSFDSEQGAIYNLLVF